MNRIGKKIRERRKAVGMTQRVLAAEVGCGCGYLSEIENGKKKATGALLRNLRRFIRPPEEQPIMVNGRTEGVAFVVPPAEESTPSVPPRLEAVLRDNRGAVVFRLTFTIGD